MSGCRGARGRTMVRLARCEQASAKGTPRSEAPKPRNTRPRPLLRSSSGLPEGQRGGTPKYLILIKYQILTKAAYYLAVLVCLADHSLCDFSKVWLKVATGCAPEMAYLLSKTKNGTPEIWSCSAARISSATRSA